MSIQLSAEQERARTAILSWYRSPNRKPWFLLQGPAGSGKSSVITATTDCISGDIIYLAPTAKSALVMKAKGCKDPRTVHSVCYRPKGLTGNKDQVNKLHALSKLSAGEVRSARVAELLPGLINEGKLLAAKYQKDVEEAKAAGKSELPECPRRLTALRKAVKDNIANPEELIDSSPMFDLRDDSPAKDAQLLVIDEGSMISAKTFTELLSFNVPILIQGDKWQLPPVKAQSFMAGNAPDFELEEIHRQAKDSPIIHLATLARERKRILPGTYGNCLVTRESMEEEAMAADQILIGTHKTRHRINALYRKLKGYTSPFPEVGERLICRHNDSNLRLLNGEQYTTTFVKENKDELRLGLVDDEGDSRGTVVAHKDYFLKKEPNPFMKFRRACMDFSGSITVHSAQGSQYPSVYVVDESSSFGADAHKHRYTAYTRAAEKLVVRI